MNKEEAINMTQKAHNNYYDVIIAFSKQFCNYNKGLSITSETLKAKYIESGNPKPKEPRVWGAVMRELIKGGSVTFTGYVKYQAKQGHARPSASYIIN